MTVLVPSVRFAAKSAGLVGTTVALWSLLDLETRYRARARHAHPPDGAADPWRLALSEAWAGRWARALCRILGVELTAAGPYLEAGVRYPATAADGVGRLFIMNHRSGLDILITIAALEASLVSRADLADWPFIGPGARRIGTLFVDRDDTKSALSVLSDIGQRLRSGRAVILFPEGTAFAGDEVRPFKPGAFLAARRSGAEVVPLGIAYHEPEVVFGDESFARHMRRVAGLARVHVALEVGEPLALGKRRAPEAAELAREAVSALVARARRRLCAALGAPEARG